MSFQKLFLSLALFFVLNPIQAQDKKNHYRSANNMILEESAMATSLVKREFVEKQSNDDVVLNIHQEALHEWKEELKKDPENSNLNYKMGLCYYFSYDQRSKALPYFKKAINNLTNSYDFTNPKENKAPFATFYFLGDTYLENNQPDSAIKYFSMYEDDYESVPIITELALFNSINAKQSLNNPRNVSVKNIGNGINSEYAETNPVMSMDNKVLFFSSRRPGSKTTDTTGDKLYDADIYFAVKNNEGKWENPIPFLYNSEWDEAPLYISPNGDVMYFRKYVKTNFDIYYTSWENKTWSKPKALTEVNTPFNETGLSLTADGKTLYFCSDQNKAAGKYDIFRYIKQSNGKWGQLELLSSMINTPYNQLSPYISPDGNTLFFSSNGSSKKGIGGYDIFYSERLENGTWSEPNTMGYPINNTRDNINYYVASEDKRYFSSLTEMNSYDIFIVEGGGFDFESIAAGTEVVTVTNEMGVTQVMETEKSVEKEVEVTTAVETIVEKEVEVVKAAEEVPEAVVPVVTDLDLKENTNDPDLKNAEEKKEDLSKIKIHLSPEQLELDNLDDESKAKIIDNVKRHLSSELKENESVIFKILNFDLNKKSLNGLCKTELNLLISFMKENPTTRLELVGHTDNTGSWSFNNSLSNKRAEEAYNYLLSKNISPKRLHFYGKGSSSPFASNDTEEGKAKNRRVEIILRK